jgi:nucleoporin NUP60
MDHRRALTPKLSTRTGRGKTPYDRPPVTPRNGQRGGQPSTPGSILSRVKNLFTPSAWRTPQRQQEEEDSVMGESDDINVKRFEYPEPAVVEKPSLDRFDEAAQELSSRMSSRSPNSSGNSPNQRLAEFFKKKGDNQLSEMEVEGVMSLINQAKSQNESLLDFNNLQTPTFQSPADNSMQRKNENSHEGRVSLGSIGLHTPVRMKSPASNDSSPVSTPKYSPFYSTNKRPSLPSASNSAKTRKTIHYANIPTPYRPGSRTSTRLSNPLNLSTSQDALIRDEPAEKSTKEREPETTKQVEDKKPMSQTASALLSLIGDDEKEEETKTKEKEKEKEKHYNDIPDDMKSFVNPYASPARRSSPHKKQRQNVRKESPKPNAIKELEKTMPKDYALPPPPAASIADKYKPARSSGLRKSIVPSPEKEKLETPEKKRDRSSSLFKVSPATTASNTTESKERNEPPKPTPVAAQTLFKLGSEKEKETEKEEVKEQEAPKPKESPFPKPTPPQLDEKPGSLFSANVKPATPSKQDQETKPSLFSAFGGQSSTTISPSKPLASAVSNTPPTKPNVTETSPFKFGLSETTPSTTQFTFPSVPTSTFSPSPQDLASLESLKKSTFFQF